MAVIGGIEVDNKLLAEYIEEVRAMIKRSNDLPLGVRLPFSDETRTALHDIILTSVRQERGSPFSMALSKYLDDLCKKEGWFD